MTIINKSKILGWNAEEINKTPSSCGIYVLRNIPSINGIIFIGSSKNLLSDIKELFNSNKIPEAAWFDWYETDDEESARLTQKEWIEKYTPKYNT